MQQKTQDQQSSMNLCTADTRGPLQSTPKACAREEDGWRRLAVLLADITDNVRNHGHSAVPSCTVDAAKP